MLKDIFYVGLGSAAVLKERIQKELDVLQEKGKLSKEDAKNFLSNLQNKGEEEEAKAKEKIKSMLKEVIDELGLVTKDDLKDFMKKAK